MKKSKRQRERSESRRASATDRAEKARGTRPYLNLPSNVKLFAFEKEGTKKIDILEYKVGKYNRNAKKGQLYFELTFFVHRGIGPDNESHLCLNKTYSKPCPVCQHRARLAKDPDANEEELDALKPSERQLFAIVDPKKKKDGVKIIDISNWFFGKELDAAIRKAKKKHGKKLADMFASPDEGMTALCEVEEGSYQGRAHYKVKLVKLVPRQDQYDASIAEEVPCLDELLKPTPYDKLKELFDQSSNGDEDEDEDDDDTDTDDEDDSNDDEDDSDDDDESEDEDDDDEDDDSDDEDDADEDDSDESDEDDSDEEDDEDDSDDDESSDEDGEEEPSVEKGSKVKFAYKGKKHKGKVVRIRHGMAYVKTADRSDPYIVDPADCTVL